MATIRKRGDLQWEVRVRHKGHPTPKRGPAPKLQQQLEQISQLPKAKQRLVMEMLETVIHQAS